MICDNYWDTYDIFMNENYMEDIKIIEMIINAIT